MNLFVCKPADIDHAWRNGADVLAEATKWASREITADQLKFLLARGERTLIGARDETGTNMGRCSSAATSEHQNSVCLRNGGAWNLLTRWVQVAKGLRAG